MDEDNKMAAYFSVDTDGTGNIRCNFW